MRLQSALRPRPLAAIWTGLCLVLMFVGFATLVSHPSDTGDLPPGGYFAWPERWARSPPWRPRFGCSESSCCSRSWGFDGCRGAVSTTGTPARTLGPPAP
jgi:hypothetical protein